MSKDIQLPVHRVVVQRGLEHIATECFEHELPILEVAHGEGMVEVAEKNAEKATIPPSAGIELRRLRGKYNRKNEDVVSRVYRDARDLAARVDGLTLDAAGSRPSQAGIKRRKAKGKADKAGE
jgi:hypothetical protein